jgi:AbrB family looped-hinge helix DNA binding protein
MSKLTTKSQVTLPKPIRQYLDVKPGDEVTFTIENGKVLVMPAEKKVNSCFGLLKNRYSGPPIDIDEAIQASVFEDDERIRKGLM